MIIIYSKIDITVETFLKHESNILTEMRIGISEIILYHLKNTKGGRINYSGLERLPAVLGRSRKTLMNNISLLTREGYLDSSRDPGNKWLYLTDKGLEKYQRLFNGLEELYFTRENHGISEDMKLLAVLNRFRDPEFGTFLLSLFIAKKEFDLLSTLKGVGLIENDTSPFLIFSNTGHSQKARDIFSSAFYRYTYLGDANESNIDFDTLEGVLVHAETLRRKGEYGNAMGLYESLISRSDLSRNIWFLANIGIVHCIKRKGDPLEALKHLEMVEGKIEDRLKLAYLNEVKADIMILVGDHEEAERLFRSSVSTFEHYKHSLLLFVGYNNWGVLRYNSGSYELAEKMWKKARIHANDARSEPARAIVLCNLSSIDSYNNRFEDAERKLKRAEDIYTKRKDLEGISLVEYNRAILYLEKGMIDHAFDHYTRSFKIAYPLPFELEKMERKKQFNVRTMRKLYIGVGCRREKLG